MMYSGPTKTYMEQSFMRRFWVIMSVAIFACALIGQAQARPLAEINYPKEFNESDLVVIATPTSRTTDTNERSLILDIYRQDKDGKQVPVPSIGVETPFRISLVLKGDSTLTQFTLHHYRLAQAEAVVNGPMLFFSAAPNRSSYLLFLVHEPDGRYAPTGGQEDPAYEAIHPLL